MRTWLAYLLVAAMIIVPFLIWGDFFMGLFSEDTAVQRLTDYGQWAWAVALLLLIADLFLPLPGTKVDHINKCAIRQIIELGFPQIFRYNGLSFQVETK